MPQHGLSTCPLPGQLVALLSSKNRRYYSKAVHENGRPGPWGPQPLGFCFDFCRFCAGPGALSFPLEEYVCLSTVCACQSYVCPSIISALSHRLTNQWMSVSNTGMCLYMGWTAIGCLNQFINSVVWNKNVVNRVPVWCDISEAFSCSASSQCHFDPLEAVWITVGLSVAIPASALCILQHLHRVTSLWSIGVSKHGVSSICHNACIRSAMLSNIFCRQDTKSWSTYQSGWVFHFWRYFSVRIIYF